MATDFPNNGMTGQVTYWAPAGTNRYGQPTFAAGVKLAGRWEDKAVQVRRNTGEEFTSQSVVYLESAVALGGMLVEGDLGGVGSPPLTAKEIQQTETIPDLRSLGKLHRAFL